MYKMEDYRELKENLDKELKKNYIAINNSIFEKELNKLKNMEQDILKNYQPKAEVNKIKTEIEQMKKLSSKIIDEIEQIKNLKNQLKIEINV